MPNNSHCGGAITTINGLKFENKTDLSDLLVSFGLILLDDKRIKNKKYKGKLVLIDDLIAGVVFQKYDLYRFFSLDKNNEWKSYISKKLIPDDCFYNFEEKCLYIIEKKFQKTNGSVDEKLQTCDFKKKEFQRLLFSRGVKIEYIYILCDFYRDEKYKDVLEYIKMCGCNYYFNSIDISAFGIIKEFSRV